MAYFPTSGGFSTQRRTHVRDLLVRKFSLLPHRFRDLGASFYPDWNEDARYIADRSGIGLEHAGAMMARLSPSTEAEMNRMMAYQTMSIGDAATEHIHHAAALTAQAAVVGHQLRVARATFPDAHPDIARLHDEHQSLLHAANQHRMLAGIVGTPLGEQSSLNISHALRLRDENHPDPLSTLGEVKIGDFGRTIVDPWYPGQVVDTHFHDAMANRYDIPYKGAGSDRGLSAPGRYGTLQEVADSAYRKAGERELLDMSLVPPNGFMGGIWYGHQQAKVERNPSAAATRRASETKLANYVSKPGNAAWNPAAHGQRPVRTHITT